MTRDELIKAQEKLGWSWYAIAIAVDVSSSTVLAWKDGKSKVPGPAGILINTWAYKNGQLPAFTPGKPGGWRGCYKSVREGG